MLPIVLAKSLTNARTRLAKAKVRSSRSYRLSPWPSVIELPSLKPFRNFPIRKLFRTSDFGFRVSARMRACFELRISRFGFLVATALVFESASNKRCIMPAETERVVHGHSNLAFLRLVSGVVEITLRIRIVQIDRGRNDRIANGECAGSHLHRAR